MAPRLSNTLVLDNGAYSIKAGYASRSSSLDDCVLSPNCIARTRDRRTLVGKQLENFKDYGSISFRQPVEKGYLVNWEAEKEIWDRLFMDENSILKCDTPSTTLLLTEGPNTPPSLQANCDQMVFEEYEFGAYYRCVGSSLVPWNDNIPSLFDTNSQQASVRTPLEAVMVIDSGYSFTHVMPVINGEPWHSAISRLDVGGKVMTNYLKEVLSIRQLNMMDETYIVNEIKEACCFVSTNFSRDLEKCKMLKSNNDIVVDYLLPDYKSVVKGEVVPHGVQNRSSAANGDQRLVLGNERFTVPELLFSPGDIGHKQTGLHEVILDSLDRVPEKYRAMLLANIVLVGGNTMISGFKERLEAELRPLAPENCIIRIGVPEKPLQYIWQGGVALANNKSVLDQKRVTRAEYLEHGSSWLSRRFNGQTGKQSGASSQSNPQRRG